MKARRVRVVKGFAAVLFVSLISFGFNQRDRLKDPQAIAEGERLFATGCASGYCHGAGGVGGGGPRLRGKQFQPDYLFKIISNGIVGTPMIAFKTELSEDQIWKVVAYVMSDGKTSAPASAPVASERAPEPATTPGAAVEVAAGKRLFFDSSHPSQQGSCSACHAYQGEGATIGPDLSSVARQSPKQLLLGIVMPQTKPGSAYAIIKITLKGGDEVVGIKKEEDAESIRLYDITELPAVLRTIQRSDVARTEAVNRSPHRDYASAYTLKQLLEIIAFLKSADPASKPLTLKDLL